MATVFVVQGHVITDPLTGRCTVEGPGEQDISSAQEYGNLFSLLPPGQVTMSIGQSVLRLNRVLKEFTDEDYLLLIGDPLAIGLAVAVAARWNNGRVSLLKWDRREKTYLPIKADVFQLTMKEIERNEP